MLDYKVQITKQEKRDIRKPTTPRPEIDILAYDANKNELHWIECKSYIDSTGVRYSSFVNKNDPGYARYKIFNDDKFRNVVTNALKRQVLEKGLCSANPKVIYCLVAGHIYNAQEREKLHVYFSNRNWILYDEKWIHNGLTKYAATDYEDDIAIIVAKLFSNIEIEQAS